MSNLVVVPPADYPGVTEYARDTFQTFFDTLDTDIYITSGLRPGDPAEHGKGEAVDIVVPAFAGRLLDLYHLAEQTGLFGGIGVYPHWMYDSKPVGGLHLDIRTAPARWMGLGSARGQQYVALNQENLKKYGVI